MSDSPFTYHIVLGADVQTVRESIMEVGPYPTALDALRNAARFVGMTANAVDADVVDERIINGTDESPAADWLTDNARTGGFHITGYTIERYTDEDGTDGSWSLNGGLRSTIREAVAA